MELTDDEKLVYGICKGEMIGMKGVAKRVGHSKSWVATRVYGIQRKTGEFVLNGGVTNYQHGVDTLCWRCKKATGGCSWSREFKPVDGWTAKKTTVIAHYKDRDIPSYCVLKCPLYEDDVNGRRSV